MTGKRRLTYLAVIGVGVGALVIDRLLAGGGPAAAAGAVASAASGPGPAETPLVPQSVLVGQLLVSVLPFPDPPVEPEAAEFSRDPFNLSPAIVQALMPPPALPADEAAAAAEAVESQAIATFEERHLLSGVMMVGDEQVAVVDGMSVEVGSQVDDCILAAIAARSILFSCPAGPVELHLQSPMPRAASRE